MMLGHGYRVAHQPESVSVAVKGDRVDVEVLYSIRVSEIPSSALICNSPQISLVLVNLYANTGGVPV